ncbi:hypothetical protein Are01nite_11790 [Actinoplanes regularis]|nr:hypothetical protein Are01nite_11790 [Actinoplanes regularis]
MIITPRMQHADGTFGCTLTFYVKVGALRRLGITAGYGPVGPPRNGDRSPAERAARHSSAASTA